MWPIPDLSIRRRRDELMDQTGLDARSHHQALEGLTRINYMSTATQTIWRALGAHWKREGATPSDAVPRLLDLAAGGGDLAIAIKRRANRAGIMLEVAGCDRSPLAIEHAVKRSQRAGVDVSFFEHDVVNQPIPADYDILVSCLFLHHLNEVEAVHFLTSMAQSARGLMLVDDLARGPAGWVLASLGVRLLSRSRIVHVDGPRSVEGAFTPPEAISLVRQAGWDTPTIHHHWPCRFLLVGKPS